MHSISEGKSSSHLPPKKKGKCPAYRASIPPTSACSSSRQPFLAPRLLVPGGGQLGPFYGHSGVQIGVSGVPPSLGYDVKYLGKSAEEAHFQLTKFPLSIHNTDAGSGPESDSSNTHSGVPR